MRMKNLEELLKHISTIPELTFLSDLKKDFEMIEIYLVGGALRDWLVGRNAHQVDFDFVIRKISLEKLVPWLEKHGTVNIVGKTFGVLKFKPKNGNTEIDIALPRTEQAFSNTHGGYRDVTVETDPDLPLEKDLARRDFTVNAMALNLLTGELIDPFGGQHDLEAKILSAVGYAPDRFQEDLTRILRGIRFAVELNFEIEPQTLEAMKSLIPEINQLQKEQGVSRYVVSRETIGDELSKSFFANPTRTIYFLQELRALEELFPSVWRHVQVDAHYLEPITRMKSQNLEQTIILLLRGLTESEARTTLSFTGLDTMDKQSPRRLDVDHILWMIQRLQQNLTPETVTSMRAHQFEKQFLGARGTQHKQILEHLGHHHLADAIHKRRTEICERWKCEEHEPIASLISGDDVLRLGIPAGAQVREILEQVRDEQLDGRILTREAAIQFIKRKME